MNDINPGPAIEAEKKKLSAGKQLLLDLGPLLLFFLANWRFDIFTATAVFMVAILTAMIISYVAVRHVSGLQLFSAVLVLVMGGLTIWLQSETFIKIKPTLFYGSAGSLLLFGVLTGRPLLKSILGSAYPGLSTEGWMKLSRNWAYFFIAMAGLNEIVWRTTSTDFWISFKIWAMLPLTFIFAAANMPMLMRHGLKIEEKE
ncbi:septation protein A [Sphingomicrobium lutaoense]|uniref:Inner membrane-spanning protein YciB n=1 Tax=Sphingomicrobium lutaoense TaxID=515949 RepID=A0A839Z4S8_9SPHN|nr:septation protein A [Sphingomicrobium lutaoense]MBB3763664.1 intracellular septation protein [Sphingomicrobium lutaoense]